MKIAMKVESTLVTQPHTPATVVLKPKYLDDKHIKIPIQMGIADAGAINAALRDQVPTRPLTHSLIATIIQTTQSMLTDICINDVQGTIFKAQLTLLDANNETHVIDCRPSDAIALAIVSKMDFYVTDTVIQKASFPDFESIKQDIEDQEVIEFISDMEDLSDEDFFL